MNTKRKKSTEFRPQVTFGIKARTEIGKAFIAVAYLAFVAVFITQLIGNRQIPTILELLSTILLIVSCAVVGVYFLDSAERDENRKKIP